MLFHHGIECVLTLIFLSFTDKNNVHVDNIKVVPHNHAEDTIL